MFNRRPTSRARFPLLCRGLLVESGRLHLHRRRLSALEGVMSQGSLASARLGRLAAAASSLPCALGWPKKNVI